jgi:hypothetical protein
MYAITAAIEFRGSDGWNHARQVPTFYLNRNVQGIVSEDHARSIAEDIITASVPDRSTVRCLITACEVSR